MWKVIILPINGWKSRRVYRFGNMKFIRRQLMTRLRSLRPCVSFRTPIIRKCVEPAQQRWPEVVNTVSELSEHRANANYQKPSGSYPHLVFRDATWSIIMIQDAYCNVAHTEDLPEHPFLNTWYWNKKKKSRWESWLFNGETLHRWFVVEMVANVKGVLRYT